MKKKTAALTLIGSFLTLALFATAYGSGRGSGYGYYGSRYEYSGAYGSPYYGYYGYRGSNGYERGSRYEYSGAYGGRYYNDDRYEYRGRR